MNNTTDAHALLVKANDEIAHDLIPAMVYLALLMLLGIVGNLLVCFIFFFRLRMTTQDCLIIALAVFDLLSCFIAMPTEIVDMRYFYMFDNEFACRLLRFIIHFCAFASILTLIVIAIDRYMKVCYPLQRQMSLKNVKVAIVIILLIALILAFPATILYGVRTTEVDNVPIPGHDCSVNDSVKDTVYPLLYNSILFVAFFLVLITLTVIYIRIWREMKRHIRYMARNSVTGGSRFYLSSASEASSACEYPPSSGGGRLSLPTDNGNDDVFVDSAQRRRSTKENGDKRRVQSKSGCSGSDSSIEHQLPSVQSDTTLCETELDVKQVNETEQGHENMCVIAENGTQGLEGENKPFQRQEDIQTDTGDAGYSEVQSSVTANATSTSPASLDEALSALGEVDKENALIPPNPNPIVSDSAFSVDDKVITENKDASDPGLKDMVSGTPDRISHHCFEEGVGENSDLTLTSTTFDDITHMDPMSSISHNEHTCFPRRNGHGEDIVKCNCDTITDDVKYNYGANMDGVKCNCDTSGVCVEDSLTDGREQEDSTTVPKNCSNLSGASTTGRTCPPTVSSEIAEGSDTAPTLFSEISETSDATPTLFGEISESNDITPTLCGEMSESSDITPALCGDITESGDAHTTVSNHHKEVKTSDTGNSEGGAHNGDAAPRRSSTAKTDRHRVDSVLKKVVAETVTSKRKVSKSRSVSEVKSHKATVIATSVTVVFFLSFVPHLSLITVRTINTEFDRNLTGAGLVLYNIFLRSYFINSVSNPIIYGVLNSRFRQECVHVFRQIVSCRKRLMCC